MRTHILITFMGLLFFTSCRTIRPEAVKLQPKPFLLTNEVSNIDASIHFDLDPIEKKVNELVPTEIKSGDAWITESVPVEIPIEVPIPNPLPFGPHSIKVTTVTIHKDVQYKYGVTRNPFLLSAVNNSITLKTDVSYWAEARTRFGALFYVSCGKNEAMPQLNNVGLSITPTIDNNFNVNPNISALQISPGNHCKLSVFNFDVTDKIKDKVQDLINQKISDVNSLAIQKINSREKLLDFWDKASDPQLITTNTWFFVQPSSFYISSLQGSGKSFTVNLGVRAYPSLFYLSTKPQIEKINPSQFIPSDQLTPGFKINTNLTADLNELIKKAKQQLVGKKITIIKNRFLGTKKIKIKDIDIYGRNDEFVIETHITGALRGILFFTGKLNFDEAKNIITVQDFDYSVETNNLLVKVADWLKHSSFKNEIEKRLSIDINPQINDAKKSFNTALNQSMGNVKLNGNLNELSFKNFNIDFCDNIINVYLVAKGILNIDVH